MARFSVAVLLAACNGERWIEEQINTILNQKEVRLHIYVSVDLSTDNTLETVLNLAKFHSGITVLPYGEKFGSAAPNFYYLLLNVPVENYDYVALSDQDDIWYEDKLSRAICKLREQNAFGYSGNVIAFWKNGKKKVIEKSFKQTGYDYFFEVPGPGCTFVLEKELVCATKGCFLERKGLLREIRYHDWLIYAFARSRNFKWVTDGKYCMEYRQHSNNQLGVNNGIRAFWYRAKKIIRGEGMEQAVKIIIFLNLEDSYFVKKWLNGGRVDYIKLASLSKFFRRRRRDQIYFFLYCVFSFLKETVLE
jgi:rhamnosyltransferase